MSKSEQMKQAIAYYRVSTDRQGRSGLGLEAQKEAVSKFASANGFQLVQEFTEIETGRKKNRPQLEEALKLCKRSKQILIIAKLDRLARNVLFVASLIESKADFVAVDNPHATKTMLQMLAVFAEFESDQIRSRVKEALAAAKRRGVELGKNGKILAVKNKIEASRYAGEIQPILSELENSGFKTIRAKVAELNRRNIPSREGKKWHIRSLHRITERVANFPENQPLFLSEANTLLQ